MFNHLHIKSKIALLKLSGIETIASPDWYLFIKRCMSLT